MPPVVSTVIFRVDGNASYNRLTGPGRKGGVAPGTDWRSSGNDMTSLPSPSTGRSP